MSTPGSNMTNVLIGKARADRERRRSGRSRITALTALAVVGGIGLLLALTVGGDPNEPPTCDDKTMARGDTCVIYSNRGGGGSFSYEEMVDRSESSDSVLRGIGFGLAGLCAVLMVPVAIRLDPATPWGDPVSGPCPRCGKPNRRERKTTHSVSQGRTTAYWTGIVTLCTCGFGDVRRP
ncbi:hypothetical protein EAO75_37395 [Streptomyces sp. uw30]|uniref:hypothetical protein n=1 Tax=Streptomyces sp. uw30 TaxID=1828179 RepID=UPI0011CDAFA0|nr:hypothetical protein [Streptomyces sp. uw30]TXS40613.1 hypothetical protein EAO75_37395 [Streptomyces sp. uw30]